MADGTVKPVMNIDEVEFAEMGAGSGFSAQRGSLSAKIGAEKLGYAVVVVPPGKAAWPFHTHYANEEMFLILEGQGTLRYGDEEYPLRQGDVICCPPGPGRARQIRNTSDVALKYLALSTALTPEVAEYPDSDKVGVICGGPGEDMSKYTLVMFSKKSDAVPYYEGEPE